MLDQLNLIRGGDYVVNELIKIHNPTIDEIRAMGEEKYFRMVSAFCATPSDYKVFLLDNLGLNWYEVDEFDFFGLIVSSFSVEETSILFGKLNFADYIMLVDEESGQHFLYNAKDETRISDGIYQITVDYIRQLHGFQKTSDKPGNAVTQNFMLNKERKRLKREGHNKFESILAPMIIALVNCEQFKYKYSDVWSLNIYLFMLSLRRIQKDMSYKQVMQGVFAGTVDANKISQKSLNWLGDAE